MGEVEGAAQWFCSENGIEWALEGKYVGSILATPTASICCLTILTSSFHFDDAPVTAVRHACSPSWHPTLWRHRNLAFDISFITWA